MLSVGLLRLDFNMEASSKKTDIRFLFNFRRKKEVTVAII